MVVLNSTSFYLSHALSLAHFVIIIVCIWTPGLIALTKCLSLALEQSFVFPIRIEDAVRYRFTPVVVSAASAEAWAAKSCIRL